jgi:hypothetical protein
MSRRAAALIGASLWLMAPLPAPANAAGELTRLMPAGAWELRYDRQARLRGLGYNKAENGSSRLCVGKDPRATLIAWLGDKKCAIDDDHLFGKTWRMRGACRVKWSKQPVPIEVDIRLDDGKRFVMDMRTPGEAMLDYREHGEARHVGRVCADDAESAVQGKENH